jgi:hypothetical protein
LLRSIGVETIPPRELTMTRMTITETRLRAYWNDHGTLPPSLDALPPLKNRDDAVTDGWGRRIDYAVTPPATVTLTSHGDGGAPIAVTFRVDD